MLFKYWREINQRLKNLIQQQNHAAYEPTLRAYHETLLEEVDRIEQELWRVLFQTVEQLNNHFINLNQVSETAFRNMVIEVTDPEMTFFRTTAKDIYHIHPHRKKLEELKESEQFLKGIEEKVSSNDIIKKLFFNHFQTFQQQAFTTLKDLTFGDLPGRYYWLFSFSPKIMKQLYPHRNTCMMFLIKRLISFNRLLEKKGLIRIDAAKKRIEYFDLSYAKKRELQDQQLFLLEWKIVILNLIISKEEKLNSFWECLLPHLAQGLTYRHAYGSGTVEHSLPEVLSLGRLRKALENVKLLFVTLEKTPYFAFQERLRIDSDQISQLLTLNEQCTEELSSVLKSFADSSSEEKLETLRCAYTAYCEQREELLKWQQQVSAVIKEMIQKLSPTRLNNKRERMFKQIEQVLSLSTISKSYKDLLLKIKHQVSSSYRVAEELQRQIKQIAESFEVGQVKEKVERDAIERTLNQLKNVANQTLPTSQVDLLSLLEQYQAPYKKNDVLDFKKKIEELKTQLETINSENPAVVGTITRLKEISLFAKKDLENKLLEMRTFCKEMNKDKTLHKSKPLFTSIQQWIDENLENQWLPALYNSIQEFARELKNEHILSRCYQIESALEEASEAIVMTTWIKAENAENVHFIRWKGAPISEDPYYAHNETHIPFPECSDCALHVNKSIEQPSPVSDKTPQLKSIREQIPVLYEELNKLRTSTNGSQEINEFIERLQNLWTQYDQNDLDDIWINLYHQAIELLSPPTSPLPLKDIFCGTYNQFSLKKRDGTEWPPQASSSSCTANALMFLVHALRAPSIQTWLEDIAPSSSEGNGINQILDEGRNKFEMILQAKRQEVQALPEEERKVLMTISHGDALNVAEMPNIQASFQLNSLGGMTWNLTKDGLHNTTVQCFKHVLVDLSSSLSQSLGLTITCNGSTYGCALILEESQWKYLIFDSHGSRKMTGHSQAFICVVNTLDEAASFFGHLIHYEDLELDFLLPTEKKAIITENKLHGLNQIAIYRFTII